MDVRAAGLEHAGFISFVRRSAGFLEEADGSKPTPGVSTMPSEQSIATRVCYTRAFLLTVFRDSSRPVYPSSRG